LFSSPAPGSVNQDSLLRTNYRIKDSVNVGANFILDFVAVAAESIPWRHLSPCVWGASEDPANGRKSNANCPNDRPSYLSPTESTLQNDCELL
jgi:hypothetical protein